MAQKLKINVVIVIELWVCYVCGSKGIYWQSYHAFKESYCYSCSGNLITFYLQKQKELQY